MTPTAQCDMLAKIADQILAGDPGDALLGFLEQVLLGSFIRNTDSASNFLVATNTAGGEFQTCIQSVQFGR